MTPQESQIWSIYDLETHYRRNSGGRWFDDDTMKFWNTRLSTDIYYGQKEDNIYFVTSERVTPYTSRRYSVRFYNPKTFRIGTVGNFNQILSLAAAKRWALRISREGITE